MKIEFASATGDSYGQFIIHAKTEQDCAILENFLKGEQDQQLHFGIHGYSFYGGHIRSFNFGWKESAKKPSIIERIRGIFK